MTDRWSVDQFLAAFGERERGDAGRAPAWLAAARRQAIARFADRGLPTRRDEDWKYTSLAPLAEASLDPSAVAGDPEVAEHALERFSPVTSRRFGPAELPMPPGLNAATPRERGWHRLVFVDGVYAAKLSSPDALPAHVTLAPLSDALVRDEVATRLAAELPEDADAFAALNAAFWRGGAYLHVPAGVGLAEPVELIHVATGGGRVDHPRSLVVLDEGSRATVLETYIGLDGEPYLTNAVTEIVLGSGARIDHVKATLESPAGFHIGHLPVSLARESRFASCAATLGGRLVRHGVRAMLGAEQASCALDGLFVIGGDQHVDMHTLVDHAAPRATSRQLYKGVLDGKARGVFNGRVVVRHGANGTDAHQTNKNLLLSDGVEVDSKPQLEIFADDVKCSHGAADGQLADDAIFYLKSRGLDEAAARTLLTHGFANEVLDRIPVEAIRTWLASHLAARLRGGRVLEEGPTALLPSGRAS